MPYDDWGGRGYERSNYRERSRSRSRDRGGKRQKYHCSHCESSGHSFFRCPSVLKATAEVFMTMVLKMLVYIIKGGGFAEFGEVIREFATEFGQGLEKPLGFSSKSSDKVDFRSLFGKSSTGTDDDSAHESRAASSKGDGTDAVEHMMKQLFSMASQPPQHAVKHTEEVDLISPRVMSKLNLPQMPGIKKTVTDESIVLNCEGCKDLRKRHTGGCDLRKGQRHPGWIKATSTAKTPKTGEKRKKLR